jgi:hypothetical protein
MSSALFASIATMDESWMLMFNPETKLSSMKAHRLNATEEISGYASAKEMMVDMFWDSEGVILTHCVSKCPTVTSETYEDVLRTKFIPTLCEKQPQNAAALIVHHDNAASYRAARVHHYFESNNF